MVEVQTRVEDKGTYVLHKNKYWIREDVLQAIMECAKTIINELNSFAWKHGFKVFIDEMGFRGGTGGAPAPLTLVLTVARKKPSENAKEIELPEQEGGEIGELANTYLLKENEEPVALRFVIYIAPYSHVAEIPKEKAREEGQRLAHLMKSTVLKHLI